MQHEVSTKFSVYGLLCNILIWHLRLLTVPIEMLTHVEVGERYFGFSGLLAVLTIGALAWWEGSSMLYLLMTIVVLRAVAHRAWCVWRRRAGYAPLMSRSSGRPVLGVFLPRISEMAMRGIEPVLLMVSALVFGAISGPLGGYLMWSSFALLGVTVVRTSFAYNRMLDQLDAQIESALPVARTSDRMLFDQFADAQLLEA